MNTKIIFVFAFLLFAASARMTFGWPYDSGNSTNSGNSSNYWYSNNTGNESNTTNATNQTYLTYQTIQAQLWGWWNRDQYQLMRNFSWNSYFLSNGQFYNYYNLEWALNDIFNSLYVSDCPDFWFGDVFALNTSGRVQWQLNCSTSTLQGAIIYEVNNGLIQHAIFEKFVVSNFSNTTNFTNQTYLTYQTVRAQQWGWWNRNAYQLMQNFSYNSFFINRDYALYYNDLYWGFNYIFNWMNYSGCRDFTFGNIFALNNTGRLPWELNCSTYSAKGAIIYEVKDGIIQHAVFENYTASRSSNSSNSSNETAWRIAMNQYESWTNKDVWRILSDYDYYSVAIISTDNGTQNLQGKWSFEWYFREVLDEISSCGNAYWQLPNIVNNIIYMRWWRECNGVVKVGSDTLIVNNGLVNSLIVTSNRVDRRRNFNATI